MAFTIENNMPSAGNIRWASLNMQYKGINYAIANGYTNYVYVYWMLAAPTTLVVSNTFPDLGADGCLIFLNKLGTAITVPNSTVLNGDLIVPGSIVANALAAATITGDKIAAGTISGSNIVAGTISATQIAANAIGASAISANVITGDKLVADAITAREIAAATVTTNEIAANTIVAGNIAAGTITAAKMTAGTITAASAIIADAAITGAKIANATITDANIASLNAGKITSGTLLVGTAGGERLEIIPNGGALLHGYDTDNDKTVDYGAKGIDWYDDTGNVYSRFSVSTGNKTITVGAGKDYATIQAAIDSLPKIINHTITINIYTGPYNESVLLEGFTGNGGLFLKRFNIYENVIVSSINVKRSSLHIDISYITITNINGICVYVENCNYVELYALQIIEAAASYEGITFHVSKGYVYGCTISNRAIGILVSRSEAQLDNTSGTGNGVGIWSGRGTIHLGSSVTITGTTPMITTEGGMIIPTAGINGNRVDSWNVTNNLAVGGTLNTGGAVTVGGNGNIEKITSHSPNKDEEIRIGSYYANKFYGLGLNYRISSGGTPTQHLVVYDNGVRVTVADLNLNLGSNPIALLAYPIGSIYMSYSAANPGTLFGGTWVRDCVGRMLIGQDPNDSDFDTAGDYGGEKTHTLNTTEIPAHTHNMQGTVGAAMANGNYYSPFGTTATPSGSTGGGGAHNNLSPYIVVYIWKRTA